MVTGVFTIPLLAADHATRDSAHRSSRKAVIDRFIGGPENQFLPAALQAFFAEDTCLQSVSPLLLWGGPGSGKTYLASGLATRWAKQHPLRRVWFLNAGNIHTDRLTNDWLSDKFDKLVVIDGVDRLPITPRSVSSICCLLDKSLAHSVGVVVTASRPPKQLDSLPRAIQSRLARGLVLALCKPSMETRKLIVQGYVAALGMVFTDEAVDLLINRLDFETGMLVEIIRKIHTQYFSGAGIEPVDLTRMNNHLKGVPVILAPQLPKIASLVSQHFGTTIADLKGQSRRQGIAGARSVFMYLAHNWAGHSLQKIGVYLGRRDHTTILHGCRVVETKISGDLELAKDVEVLVGILEEAVSVC